MEFQPEHLRQAIEDNPGCTARELVSVLTQDGIEASKGEVNGLLYADDDFVMDEVGPPPTWRLYGTRPALVPAPVASQQEPQLAYTLRTWQKSALDAWRANGCTGIVEAVTGTGKTLVAVDAAREEVAQGGRVLVLVPTVELLHQWQAVFTRNLPEASVDLIGDTRKARGGADITIGVINSAALDAAEGTAVGCGLLIADECHRYGARMFRQAPRRSHPRRLGLTATLERSDDGVETVLLPYFGGVVFRYDYAAAMADRNVIAPFRVAFVGVPLLRDERAVYERADTALKAAFAEVASAVDLLNVTMEDIATLAKSEDWGRPGVRAAQRYLKHRAEREEFVATCIGKRNALMSLGPALHGSRSLIFVDRTQAAEHAARHLEQCGLTAAAVHSGLKRSERRAIMDRFRQGQLDVICAPRVLDEGVDVPEADTAVVLSASRSRRQMIQRMGRVLRVKADGRSARFLIVYVTGTYEDPATSGRHEAFLAMVTDVAEEVRTFDRSGADNIRLFLLSDRRVATPLTPVPGRHRASDFRPSFLSAQSGSRNQAGAVPASRPPTRPVPRATAGALERAVVCAGCGGAVSFNGLCRCS